MEILVHPNPALASIADEVDPQADPGLKKLASSMVRTMYASAGVGLAAPQVGVLKRLIVFDVSDDGDEPMALCNPCVVEYGDERVVEDEGCLSVPGISLPVERATQIVCEALSLDGEPLRIEASGLMARMLQHETDHLDGHLILDRATPEERKAAIKRYRDAVEAGAKPGETSI